MMVSPSVLGAATGVGLALFITLTAVIWRYYARNRKEAMLVTSSNQTYNWRTKQSKGSAIYLPPKHKFSIFREQPQRTHAAHVFANPIPPSRITEEPSSSRPPTLEHVHVRLSLPDVHLPDEKVSPSQSSYSLPTMRRRSPVVSRARSMDARAMPQPIPRLSISSDIQQSNGESRIPLSPFLHIPSPELVASLSDQAIRPISPTAGLRPRSLSPLSPILSPVYSQTSDCSVSPGGVSPLGAIQPDLYKKKGMVLFQSSESQDGTKYGRLHFRLKYDFDRSDFVIHIIEALDLGTISPNGFNDPYIKVTLVPEVDTKQRQTDIRRNSTDPFFNEIFKFPVTYDDLLDKTLLLQVFDYDRFSRNDVTGEVRVLMSEVDVTAEIEVWSEIEKTEKVRLDRPEILLSLSYLPSAGRLTVVILKACNIMSLDTKEIPDPYVKVCLAYEDKKVKKKKTSTKKTATNPVWNEALSFDVSEEDLKHCHLVISVINCHHGTSPVLGTSVLGRKGHEKGIDHWLDMRSNPRKSIAMWHPLYI